MSAATIHPLEGRSIEIPDESKEVDLSVGRRTVRLTNLRKALCPGSEVTKRDLLQYYLDVAPALFPHISDRPIVMKRAPASRPDWLETCPIELAPRSIIEFPIVQDLASLLWIINLGSIDLHPWPASCDDVHRPDHLHFNLDPTPGASFEQVLEAALRVRKALDQLEIQSYVKTSGSRGLHIYVPIVRGPLPEEVWRFSMALARGLETKHPNVSVECNQNDWSRTPASVYSVRPNPIATVSTPVTWEEVERGIRNEDFRMDNVPARIRARGDLWKPLLAQRDRLRLDRLG